MMRSGFWSGLVASDIVTRESGFVFAHILGIGREIDPLVLPNILWVSMSLGISGTLNDFCILSRVLLPS